MCVALFIHLSLPLSRSPYVSFSSLLSSLLIISVHFSVSSFFYGHLVAGLLLQEAEAKAPVETPPSQDEAEIRSLMFDMKLSLSHGKKYEPPPRSDMPALPMHQYEYEVRIGLCCPRRVISSFLCVLCFRPAVRTSRFFSV